MHDAVALEKQGIPTTVVVHDTFERAARTQAQIMGLPDLPLAVMPRPRVTWDDVNRQEVISNLYQAVTRALLGQQAAGPDGS